MAREIFPKKQRGESLDASHVNVLSEVARRFSNFPSGSNLMGKLGGTFPANTPYPHWSQSPVEITNKKINQADSEDSGLYLCKIRYFDGTEWQLQDKEWELDANSIEEKYEEEDIVTAYYSQQRGLWLPIATTTGEHITFTLTEDMSGTSPREASAIVNTRNGETVPPTEEIPPTESTTVHDPQDLFIDAKGPSGDSEEDDEPGAKGKAYKRDDGDYDIVECQQLATIFLAKVDESSDVASTKPQFAVDDVTVMSPVAGQNVPERTIAIVNNILMFPSSDDDEVLIFRKQGTTNYYGIPHFARTVCTPP